MEIEDTKAGLILNYFNWTFQYSKIFNSE
jgi:hypothetical protein